MTIFPPWQKQNKNLFEFRVQPSPVYAPEAGTKQNQRRQQVAAMLCNLFSVRRRKAWVQKERTAVSRGQKAGSGVSSSR